MQFGYLQTTFAVVQLAGGPLFGRFGDLYGGRAALTLAFMSSALSYGLLGLSWNIPFLFLSRLPSVFMHAMQGTVKATISTVQVFKVKPPSRQPTLLLLLLCCCCYGPYILEEVDPVCQLGGLSFFHLFTTLFRKDDSSLLRIHKVFIPVIPHLFIQNGHILGAVRKKVTVQ